MRILFDNKLIDATFSAEDESQNYPADNLIHAFLKKRFQHSADEYDTVTISVLPAAAVDCFFFSYSNTGKIVVRFYDQDDGLLTTETFTGDNDTRITTGGDTRVTTGGDVRVTQESFGANGDSVFFSQTYYVGKIEIDVYGGSGGYLGGVAAGEAEEFKNLASPWDEPWTSNSIISETRAGQSLQEKISPLKRYQWTFRDLTRSRVNELANIFYSYGVGARVWLDPFEDNHDFLKPLYARIDGAPVVKKNGRRYDMTWEFREVK